MLHHDIHEKLLAYTDRELELLRANYQLCHKFKSHMERRFFKDNYIHIEKQTRFTKIPLHSHGFIELIYIYQGKMHQKINEESLTLGKGEILLINQFARHEIEAAGQNDIIINFIIKTEFFGRLMSLFDENNIISRFILSAINGRKKHGEHIHFKVGEIDAIQNIMHVIISEIYSNNHLKEIRVNFLVGLLMTELHQRLNAPGAPDLQTVMRQMTSGCRLLCFDEFHLHDPGDAMLIKALLEHLFQHGIVLLATSNYPPEMLLPNPLYHDRFLPSIALIRAHLTVVALNGEEDYRERHLSQDNAFCSGRMWVNPNAQQRQLYDLPSLPGEPVSLTVGYRTLLAAAASPALLHFTFTQLCQAATAVMDYLTLCESYAVWLLDEVPPLATVGPAAQQRFINVIDVLYEKQIRLLLVTRCDLETLVAGVELEDIQRTRSRLQQLPRAV